MQIIYPLRPKPSLSSILEDSWPILLHTYKVNFKKSKRKGHFLNFDHQKIQTMSVIFFQHIGHCLVGCNAPIYPYINFSHGIAPIFLIYFEIHYHDVCQIVQRNKPFFENNIILWYYEKTALIRFINLPILHHLEKFLFVQCWFSLFTLRFFHFLLIEKMRKTFIQKVAQYK